MAKIKNRVRDNGRFEVDELTAQEFAQLILDLHQAKKPDTKEETADVAKVSEELAKRNDLSVARKDAIAFLDENIKELGFTESSYTYKRLKRLISSAKSIASINSLVADFEKDISFANGCKARLAEAELEGCGEIIAWMQLNAAEQKAKRGAKNIEYYESLMRRVG